MVVASVLCMVDAATPTIAAVSARRRWWAHARTSLFWIVIVAFGVRFGYIVIGHTYRFRSDKKILAQPVNERNFDFGFEMGRIGRSLAEGQGFSKSVQRNNRSNRLGTSALSFSDRRSLPRVRSLQSRLGLGSAQSQQCFFRAYLHSDISDR